MITIPNWMFLSTFEALRSKIVSNYFIETLIHNGRGVFGSDFGSCSFTLRKQYNPVKNGVYKRLFDKQGSVASNEELEQRFHNSNFYYAKSAEFEKIPGMAIAYWIGKALLNTFNNSNFIQEVTISDSQNITGNNDRFLRLFWESSSLSVSTFEKWRFYAKGGGFRRWRGNLDSIVDWSEETIKHY